MKKLSFLLFALIIICSEGFTQRSIDFNKAYGSDPLLLNGKFYRYYQPVTTKGTPFLYEKFSNGSVVLRGKMYHDLFINFDILNRQLVLQYASDDGGLNRIVVSDAWLERFEINGSAFEPVNLGDSIPVFCKVLVADDLIIAYDLRKVLILDNAIGETNRRFSTPIKLSYIVSSGKVQRYSNNRNFISFFEEKHQQELKKFLRKNRINVKKSDDQEMMSLLNYCSELI